MMLGLSSVGFVTMALCLILTIIGVCDGLYVLCVVFLRILIYMGMWVYGYMGMGMWVWIYGNVGMSG